MENGLQHFVLRFHFLDGKFQPKFYTDGTLRDVNDGETNLSEMLVKRCRARCILQCVGIWVASAIICANGSYRKQNESSGKFK